LIGPADFPPPMGEVWFLGLGGEGPKIETRRAEARGPKGRERWWGLEPPPHQLEGLGSAVSPPAGPPGRKRILDIEDPIKRIWW